MRVLFAGSVPEDVPADVDPKAIFTGLGRAVADAGFDVVLGTCDPDTPDAWLLAGIVEAKRPSKVRIIRPLPRTSRSTRARSMWRYAD